MKKSVLEQLKKITKIAADTSDFELIKKYNPSDVTTNPSLILNTIKKKKYFKFMLQIINKVKINNPHLKINNLIKEIYIEILIRFTIKILNYIKGKVSNEIDTRTSFNSAASIKYAKNIIQRYESHGISRNRILIKIAATWEGIKAAKALEKEGINCNLTLIFDKYQAQACGEAGVYLISPFVGRITDWQIKKNNLKSFPTISNDNGVNFIKSILNLYKVYNFKTKIMGASFRNIEQIISSINCDALTISPILLKKLKNSKKILKIESINNNIYIKKKKISESNFRWQINENDMANYKLAEGIRLFTKDIIELENIIKKNIY